VCPVKTNQSVCSADHEVANKGYRMYPAGLVAQGLFVSVVFLLRGSGESALPANAK
jgi:hypothetical protein